MPIFFSPGFSATDSAGGRRLGGFFDTEIHGPDIPDDAVPVTQARHAELMDAQAEGKELYAGEDGVPRYRERRVDADQRRADLRVAIRREAASRIARISPEWKQLNDLRQPSDEGTARFAAIDAVRDAGKALVERIENTPADDLETFEIAGAVEWPEKP